MTHYSTFIRTFYPFHHSFLLKNCLATRPMTTSPDKINFEIPITISATSNKVNNVNKLVMVFAFHNLDSLLDTLIYLSFITLHTGKANVIEQPHATVQIPRHTLLAP
jgi:hypothetical protein